MTKTVLVTGASSGIGAATAILAAERGWDVAVHYNANRDGAEDIVKAVEAQDQRALLCSGDVATPDGIAQIFATLDSADWPLDALVNNAGVVDMTARLIDMDHARLRRMFDVNVIGAMLIAKEAVLRLTGRGGVIVNVTSAASRLGSGNQYVDYAASKAAMDIFTKGLSDEVAADGIRVMAVRPGLIETELHGKGGEPDRAQRLAHQVPMQRTGSALEVAQTILFLLSDEASYMTGSSIEVTGGR
ncbi:MAG: SDR family oxidoreductase [Rhodobacteraceae bacterium]|nr:SDR family oxidoreductase [Paracoccaceae bacterium]